jgi:hypothetical protein
LVLILDIVVAESGHYAVRLYGMLWRVRSLLVLIADAIAV